jgi:hypothetical protein
MENTLEVKPGASIVLNPTLDADLIEGEGKAYGCEILINKAKGRFTGSISYTYLRSLRKVCKIYTEDKIMPEGYFPSDFDIPHQLTLVLSYKTSERSTLSSSFVYMTGRPITLPDGQYIYFETMLPYYSGKNQHRMPALHRLDISYNISCKKNNTRKWKGFWKLALYNVYARNNPYSIYLKKEDLSKNTQAIQFSILGTIVPSISYSFKF